VGETGEWPRETAGLDDVVKWEDVGDVEVVEVDEIDEEDEARDRVIKKVDVDAADVGGDADGGDETAFGEQCRQSFRRTPRS
jgi:hypothetical protein